LLDRKGRDEEDGGIELPFRLRLGLGLRRPTLGASGAGEEDYEQQSREGLKQEVGLRTPPDFISTTADHFRASLRDRRPIVVSVIRKLSGSDKLEFRSFAARMSDGNRPLVLPESGKRYVIGLCPHRSLNEAVRDESEFKGFTEFEGGHARAAIEEPKPMNPIDPA
jgi:hypothetical protein